MFNRIMGVFKLDVNTFEEIEHDESATSQAAIVVALVALLAVVGSGLGAQIGEGSFVRSLLSSTASSTRPWCVRSPQSSSTSACSAARASIGMVDASVACG